MFNKLIEMVHIGLRHVQPVISNWNVDKNSFNSQKPFGRYYITKPEWHSFLHAFTRNMSFTCDGNAPFSRHRFNAQVRLKALSKSDLDPPFY